MMGPQEQEQPLDRFGRPEHPEEASGQRTDVRRGEPDPAAAREQQVKQWQDRVKKAKAYHESAFKRMRADMQFARGLQWRDQTKVDDERYVANIVLRHLQNKVAQLYAKNPKAEFQRRKRLDYAVWDGRQESLAQAQETLTLAQQAADPRQAMELPQVKQAQRLLQDVQQGSQRRQLMDRMGETLEVVYEHQISQQQPRFKAQMKQLVRRVATAGIGYVKLNFFRQYESSPEHEGRISDVRQQLQLAEQRMEDLADDELGSHQAETEELRQLLDKLVNERQQFVREGLDFDFPNATSIIPDLDCKQLDGFLGARWVAQEFLLTPKQVQQHYGVDIKQQFKPYQADEKGLDAPQPSDALEGSDSTDTEEGEEQQGKACVWEIYDRWTGLVYEIADGYNDFLREPHPPHVRLERFFPFFVLAFNDVEDESSLFPPSDVSLMRPMQEEHNIARQRLREHRDAARPKHVAPKGKFDEQDKTNLAEGPPHSVVEMNGLQPGDRIQDHIQPVPHAPLDPNLYETNPFFDDTLKAVGTQEAMLGGTAGDTATETNLAEASRQTVMGSNVDDLDEFLSEIAQNASYVLLSEMSGEAVQEIAGPGAVWPEVTAEEVAQDLWLTVRAGSSGKPNKAQEIQNFERLAPILMQVPGISPEWMAREAIERLDDRINLEEAFVEGAQSIAAMNRMTQPDQGAPGQQPSEQDGEGAAGADNTPRPGGSGTNQGPNNAASGAPPTDRPQGPTSRPQGPMS